MDDVRDAARMMLHTRNFIERKTKIILQIMIELNRTKF